MVHVAAFAIFAVHSAVVESRTGRGWAYRDLKPGSHLMFIIWCGRMWGLGVASVRVHHETRLEQRQGAEVRTASVKLEPEGSIMLVLASAWGGLLVEDESGNLYLNIFPHKIRNTRISEKKHWYFLLISEKKETSGYLLSWKAVHCPSFPTFDLLHLKEVNWFSN